MSRTALSIQHTPLHRTAGISRCDAYSLKGFRAGINLIPVPTGPARPPPPWPCRSCSGPAGPSLVGPLWREHSCCRGRADALRLRRAPRPGSAKGKKRIPRKAVPRRTAPATTWPWTISWEQRTLIFQTTEACALPPDGPELRDLDRLHGLCDRIEGQEADIRQLIRERDKAAKQVETLRTRLGEVAEKAQLSSLDRLQIDDLAAS